MSNKEFDLQPIIDLHNKEVERYGALQKKYNQLVKIHNELVLGVLTILTTLTVAIIIINVIR